MSSEQTTDEPTKRGSFTGSRWDIEILRGLLVALAMMATFAIVTGTDGFQLGSGGAHLVDEDEGNTVTISLEPSEVELGEIDGFRPTEIIGQAPVTGGTRTVQVIGVLVSAAGIVGAGVCGFLLLTDAAKDDPFARRNVRRWQYMAGAFGIYGIGQVLVSFAALDAKATANLEPSTMLNFAWVLPTLTAGAMARIWSIGAGIREEQELTV